MRKVRISDQLTDKIKVEADKCIGCNICMGNCPMLEAFCDTPKRLLEDLAKDKQADVSLPYACALCNYCITVCPKDVDLKDVFYNLRAETVDQLKTPPKELGYRSVKFHQNNSFSKIFSTDVKALEDKKIRRVFFPGCSLSSYSPDIVDKSYKYLQEKLPGIGIMLKCCGNPTYSMGQQEKFKDLYKTVEDEFECNKIDEVIVACLNCYKTIKRTSKNVKVTTLWEILSEYGVTEDKKLYYENTEKIFSIHDPCPTRYEAEIHDSVRDILKQLGIKTCEMEFNREKTLCCGSGAMIGVTSKDLAVEQREKRAGQSKSDYIVTYCEECVESMKEGGKNSVHILDLLFNKDIEKTFNQADVGIINKWVNRYKTKRRIDSYDK